MSSEQYESDDDFVDLYEYDQITIIYFKNQCDEDLVRNYATTIYDPNGKQHKKIINDFYNKKDYVFNGDDTVAVFDQDNLVELMKLDNGTTAQQIFNCDLLSDIENISPDLLEILGDSFNESDKKRSGRYFGLPRLYKESKTEWKDKNASEKFVDAFPGLKNPIYDM